MATPTEHERLPSRAPRRRQQQEQEEPRSRHLPTFHLGTATLPRTRWMTSSGRRPSSSASGLRTMRWRRTDAATAFATSSGVMYCGPGESSATALLVQQPQGTPHAGAVPIFRHRPRGAARRHHGLGGHRIARLWWPPRGPVSSSVPRGIDHGLGDPPRPGRSPGSPAWWAPDNAALRLSLSRSRPTT